jgi:thiamine biosynthesis protein ThiI
VTPDQILIRLGELTLKGKNRHRFEQRVETAVKRVLQPHPRATVQRAFGRMYIHLQGEPYAPIADALSRIFGIQSFSPVYTCENELALIQTLSLSLITTTLAKRTSEAKVKFRVTARRADKAFALTSAELQRELGGFVLLHADGLVVDIHQPELDLQVEVRETGTYVYVDSVKGAGGFPAGSNGKAVVLLSGGIDSPVAAWLAMRQGLRVELVHFHSYPYTSQQAKDKVIALGNQLTKYAREIRLHMVEFTDIQLYLKQAGQDNLLVTLMRRAMMRLSERIAEAEACGAIITGENLGQVASQTLPSLTATSEPVSLPILRPVMMMEKQEIIDLARKIGTFETSILPYEDCCTLFVPKSPATNPNLRVIHKMEEHLTELESKLELALQTKEVLILPLQADKNFSDLL